MAHEKLAGKLEAYLDRLGAGKAQKIKPRDVEKMIAKLQKRREKLLKEAREAPEKADRIAARLDSADALLARAEWLLEQIAGARPETGATTLQQD